MIVITNSSCGTSFYFNALEHGLSKLPESTKDSRKYFNDRLKNQGSEKVTLTIIKN